MPFHWQKNEDQTTPKSGGRGENNKKKPTESLMDGLKSIMMEEDMKINTQKI